ncbi:CusA/CzcA family heavy metal efflux RND transporter [Asticcacaulis sp. 201]|uniref:efflux RND transporter permease subunit n=1 Tax=Asticcacaulis sp. 201 TaxID=3028787 RepID=UPI002915EE46|nr:CusA/CzcA family heavy metal efflux RND transporter [Asticcacaulis sp. 201]MDV6331006.1 CusA/CzcA family heavy metal efflux RND transporter [Asticcacaulis sp. 201]
MRYIVNFALHKRVLILMGLAAMMAVGVFAFTQLNIEAYPDPVPPTVEVVTQSTGYSAEEMERNVTIPVEIQMAGIPHVSSVRTISLFGLSDVKVQFTYDLTHEQAQQHVINKLSQMDALPGGAHPGISPVSPIGEIMRYRVVGPKGYSLTDLKTIEDWMLERRLKAVPGVIDVTGWGGKTKSYEVVLDRQKLNAYGISVPQILAAIGNADVNVGGQTVNFGPQSAIVRGVGLVQSINDIRTTVVTSAKGIPVQIKDLGEVVVSNLPRQGIAGQDKDDDIVQGIVLMQRGAKSTPTIKLVEAEINHINAGNILPYGVHIERIYDRSDLIKITTETVFHSLVEGILFIFIVQWLFLGNVRSALIVAATIPFALCFAVIIIVVKGDSANLLSVGAIDFGLVVDATVIMMENIYRHLSELSTTHKAQALPGGMRRSAILEAASEVGKPIFFSAVIIITSFLPLFTLTGVVGRIFGPMATTYAYAIIGGLIATFTITPALSAVFLKKNLEEKDTWLVARLHSLFRPLWALCMKSRLKTLAVAGGFALFAAVAVPFLGMEFLPHLEEGNMWIRATMPASVSLEASNGYVNDIRRILSTYPEVQTVISQHGRPDDGTDATGFFNAEFFVPLKPFTDNAAWKGQSKEKLIEQMNAKLAGRFPGIEFNFSQYIQDNVEEAASGVKGENSIKLFGPDLDTLQKTAGRIQEAMSHVRGIADLGVFNSLGQPTLNITVNREKAARYGLNTGDVNAVVQAAIGGANAAAYYEPGTDRNYPIIVRFSPSDRNDIAAISRIPVTGTSPTGLPLSVPLSDVADIKLISGASFIYREGGERYVPIKFSVRGRDLGGAVKEAQARIDKEIKLPPGYHISWAGELGELNQALARLAVIVPVAIGLILVLLFMNFGSVRDMAIAGAAMPLAMIGGVAGLLLTHTPFSISAAIGFVALLGISVMDGIIVVSTYNQAIDDGLSRTRAMQLTLKHCLRPVVMTCFVAFVGLLPAAVANGVGSQVQKPLAIVVVGGASLAPLLILTVLPVLLSLFSKHVSRHLISEEVDESGATTPSAQVLQ